MVVLASSVEVAVGMSVVAVEPGPASVAGGPSSSAVSGSTKSPSSFGSGVASSLMGPRVNIAQLPPSVAVVVTAVVVVGPHSPVMVEQMLVVMDVRVDWPETVETVMLSVQET